MNISSNPTSIQTIFRALSNFLHKNYLYNQDKYRYAKRITSSYINWLNYTFSENVVSRAYVFYNKPYKIKRVINQISLSLKRNQKTCHRVLWTFHLGMIIGVSISVYLLALKSFEYLKKIDEIIDAGLIIHYEIANHNNSIIKESERFTRDLVSKHVFFSEKITFSTAKLITEVCKKPNIEAFIGKSLRNLLEKESIIQGTKNISFGALHKNFLYEEFLYVKFKNLVFAQMRKESLRNELLKITHGFIKSEYAYSVFASQFAAGLRNQGVIDSFVDGCKNKAFCVMDNDHYKTLASQKLRNLDLF